MADSEFQSHPQQNCQWTEQLTGFECPVHGGAYLMPLLHITAPGSPRRQHFGKEKHIGSKLTSLENSLESTHEKSEKSEDNREPE